MNVWAMFELPLVGFADPQRARLRLPSRRQLPIQVPVRKAAGPTLGLLRTGSSAPRTTDKRNRTHVRSRTSVRPKAAVSRATAIDRDAPLLSS